MEILRRAFACELKEINEQDRTIRFVASTEEQDRCGDIIRVAGWKFDAYDRNPVFLWAHDSSSLPIGKCVERKTDGARLLMKFQFATAEENPLAEQVFRLYKGGFLSAVSVGFKPLKRSPIHPEDRWGDLGWEFIEQELLEVSGVPVPANSSALQLMMKGLDSSERHVALHLLENTEEFAVGISLSKAEHDAFQKYGDGPAAWLSNIESLKALTDHLRSVVEEKKLGKGKRAELTDIAETMDKKYKALASACDDLVEKCRDRLQKMLDDMMMPEEEEEPKAIVPFSAETFIKALNAEMDLRNEHLGINLEVLLGAIQDIMKS